MRAPHRLGDQQGRDVFDIVQTRRDQADDLVTQIPLDPRR